MTGAMKGDTRSSDYSSCRVMEGCHLAVLVVINIEAGGAGAWGQ